MATATTYTIITNGDRLIWDCLPEPCTNTQIYAAVHEAENRHGDIVDEEEIIIVYGCTLTDVVEPGDEISWAADAGASRPFDADGRSYQYAVIRRFVPA